MASSYDRVGNSFSDSGLSGTAVAYEVPPLARRPKKPREPLGTAPAPEAIPAARLEKERAVAEEATGGGGGIASPLTEVRRETQTLRIYDPSDSGTYVDIEQITHLVMEDASGIEIEFNFTPPA
jgi:hypothetical protein